MSLSHDTLAVIFDFDDTLVPDSTTALLEAHGLCSLGEKNNFMRREFGLDKGYHLTVLCVTR